CVKDGYPHYYSGPYFEPSGLDCW
nr:immunoglobulin heavy chain junction region [Macaca mulatta]